MAENESINGWTFEETIKTAENLMEAEKNVFKWDVLRHLRDFAENYKDKVQQFETIGTVEECRVAVERMKPKKPTNIVMAKDRKICVGRIGKCPCCGGIVAEDNFTCEDCFQVLDWSE